MSTSFGSLLEEAVRRSGQSKAGFARAIGVSPSGLSRLLHTEGGASPDCEICLRVAQVSGISPFTVLHAADRDDIADVLRSLFVAQAAEALTPKERRFVQRVRRLSARSQRLVYWLVRKVAIADTHGAIPP